MYHGVASLTCHVLVARVGAERRGPPLVPGCVWWRRDDGYAIGRMRQQGGKRATTTVRRQERPYCPLIAGHDCSCVVWTCPRRRVSTTNGSVASVALRRRRAWRAACRRVRVYVWANHLLFLIPYYIRAAPALRTIIFIILHDIIIIYYGFVLFFLFFP